MNKCLYKLPHSCGSSDGLQVFESNSGITGYCFACGTYVQDPLDTETLATYKARPKVTKTEEEIKEEMAFISSLPSFDLDSRHLKKASLDYFGVKVGLSEYDGKTPAFVHFPYTKNGQIVRYKTRLLPTKKMWSIGIDNDVDLFGWEQAKATGAKRLIITEGEFDAIAILKILKIYTDDRYINSIPAVVSVPNGSGGAAKSISRKLSEINKYFKEVYLCFDDDDAGREAVAQVCKVAPNIKSINLPGKDANECLINGLGKQAFNAITFNASKPKNSRIIWARDLHEQSRSPAQWGMSWPWKKLTEATRGIRFGETYYFGAGEKMGKGELVHSILTHLIREHGLKVLLASPEESNNKSLKLSYNKATGKVFHDPKEEFDNLAYDEAGKLFANNLAMIDLSQSIDWNNLQEDIASAHSDGVKAIFIDPITNLTSGLSASETNATLSGVSPKLSSLAKDLELAIFIFCHLNKPDGGLPWDRGREVTTNYFAGSSAMARSCNYAIGLQGNKDPNLSREQRNFRELVLLADREFGESCKIPLYWDEKTRLFNEV